MHLRHGQPVSCLVGGFIQTLGEAPSDGIAERPTIRIHVVHVPGRPE